MIDVSFKNPPTEINSNISVISINFSEYEAIVVVKWLHFTALVCCIH